MDRSKNRGGKGQRIRDRKKREGQRRERVGRKKVKVREKVKRLRNSVFSFATPEGREVGSLKLRVRSHLGR